jgi:hypothetical protein
MNASTRHPLLTLVTPMLAITFVGCTLAPEYGAVGEERRVHYNAPSLDDAVFTTRVMVGSRFTVVGQALIDDDTAVVVAGGRFVSSDERVLMVHRDDVISGDIEIVGPGEAYLEVRNDDELIDRLKLAGAHALRVDLGDGTLAETRVDVRLPGRFGLVQGSEIPVLRKAYDRCSEELFVAMPSTITSENALIVDVSQESADAPLMLRAGAEGETMVSLTYENGMSARYETRVLPRADITELWPAIGHVEGQTAYLWGRAFADDDEVIAPHVSWSASPRITLSADKGPLTNATIAPDVEGVDGGPAVVTARLDDLDVDLDLYASTTNDVVTERVTPPDPAPGAGGCEGNVCDPFAAFLVFGFALRRRRR